jgi:hypothetical protein
VLEAQTLSNNFDPAKEEVKVEEIHEDGMVKLEQLEKGNIKSSLDPVLTAPLKYKYDREN